MSSLTPARSSAAVRTLTLRETLSVFMIPVLSDERVNAHKLRAFGGAITTHQRVYNVLSALLLIRLGFWLQHRIGALSAIIIWGSLIMSGLALGTFGFADGWPYALDILLLVPLLSLIPLAFVVEGREDDLHNGWMTAPIRPDGTTSALIAVPMPQRLKSRAELAGSLRGVRLRVEFFQTDPLLLAIRGWGPWKEIAYIGAWATGDAYLDSL